MDTPTPQQLLQEARNAAAGRDVGAVLQRIDDSLATASVGSTHTGELHLARAIALQCSNDVHAAAQEMRTAHSLLCRGDDSGLAAYAGAAGAVLCNRAGDLEQAVDLAVSALILLGDARPSDENALSAGNALAQIFEQLSSYDLSVELAEQTFANSDHLPMRVRGHYAFNVSQCMIEATIGHADPDPAWLDLGLRAAEYLATSPLATTPMLTSALRGKIDFLRDDRAAYIDLVDHLDYLRADDEAIYQQAGARLVPWHQLVRAAGALRWGDPRVCLSLLDAAAPQLRKIGDHRRYIRAMQVRSRARAAIGDLAGAADDARALARHTLSTQTHQVGRLAALMVRRAELERSRTELSSRADQLVREASIDPVTGLHSRRWLELRLDALSETDATIGVLMIDLDRFKDVNDTHGHPLGDVVLAEAGTIMRQSSRATDCARYGGEEFVVLIEGGTIDQTETVAKRVLEAFRIHDWNSLAPGLTLTASVGLAAGAAASVRDLVRRADIALYEAKSSGRDRYAITNLSAL